ncbi:biopolymer transporter ExbD [candidate division KSB1 bacterium]|nr:biopolymer transporter ExbD [candidate division KSB1 bacterium]
MKFEYKNKRITTFTAASLTDIVFLLLIFFLLTSSFVVQPGIKVQLPKATPTPVDTEGKIFLTITQDGLIFLNEERLQKNELGQSIRELLQKNAGLVVVIQADKRLTLEKAIEVIDIIKLAGAEKFVIATNPI